MKRTSVRTLVLLMELFVAVLSFRYVAAMRAAGTDAFWLAGAGAPAAPIPCEVHAGTPDG